MVKKRLSANQLFMVAIASLIGNRLFSAIAAAGQNSGVRIVLLSISGILGLVFIISLVLGIVRKLASRGTKNLESSESKISGQQQKPEIFRKPVFRHFRLSYLVVGTLILLIILGFYWFQVRPNRIEARCGALAETKARLDYSYTQSDYRIEDYMKHYTACLHQQGY